MQSLELLLDPDGDARVRTVWRALAEAGLPSQADHRGESNAPHVTLVAAAEIPVLPEPPAAFPLPVTLGSPLLFGDGPRRTVALLVVPTRELLDLQLGVSGTAAAGHFAAGAWTPHVTLARRVPVDALGHVAELAAELDGVACQAIALRHWDSATKTVTVI